MKKLREMKYERIRNILSNEQHLSVYRYIYDQCVNSDTDWVKYEEIQEELKYNPIDIQKSLNKIQEPGDCRTEVYSGTR